MPKFKIGWSFDGDDYDDIIEEHSLEEAEQIVKEMALERVCYWAEEIADEEQ